MAKLKAMGLRLPLAGGSRASTVAQSGNPMLLSMPVTFGKSNTKDGGRSGSAGASGKASQAQGRCLLGAPRMQPQVTSAAATSWGFVLQPNVPEPFEALLRP